MNIKKPHTAFLFFLGATILFFVLALLVQTGVLNSLNASMNVWFLYIGNDFLSYIAIIVNTLTTPTAFSVMYVFAMIFFFGRGMKREALLFTMGIVVASGLALLFKNLFAVVRPDGQIVETLSHYAFPSGHTTLATIFLFLLAFFAGPTLKHSLKEEVIFGAVFMIVLVALSRLYLSVHWLGDVLGGITLGLAVSFLMIWIFDQGQHFKKFKV